MPVGAVIGSGQVDNIITALAVRLRDVSRQISNLSLAVNGQGAGLAYLESIGYSAAANPANPGGVSDAQYAQNMISFLNTVAGVYFGTAAQASEFNFDQELSQVWGGQVGT
ncbi:MAG TPA: hypothetical protein VGL33_30400 [Streptosporangiaceae bacterium]|jgi:hypothetical protein